MKSLYMQIIFRKREKERRKCLHEYFIDSINLLRNLHKVSDYISFSLWCRTCSTKLVSQNISERSHIPGFTLYFSFSLSLSPTIHTHTQIQGQQIHTKFINTALCIYFWYRVMQLLFKKMFSFFFLFWWKCIWNFLTRKRKVSLLKALHMSLHYKFTSYSRKER